MEREDIDKESREREQTVYGTVESHHLHAKDRKDSAREAHFLLVRRRSRTSCSRASGIVVPVNYSLRDRVAVGVESRSASSRGRRRESRGLVDCNRYHHSLLRRGREAPRLSNRSGGSM